MQPGRRASIVVVLFIAVACAQRQPPVSVPPGPLSTAAFDAAAAPGVMTAHSIGVGQADATLLELPCGAMLIDAGSQTDNHTAGLLAYLREFLERRADLDDTLASVIITQNHVDHTRPLREVMEAFRVERLIQNGQRGGLAQAIAEWARQNASQLKLDYLDVNDADIQAVPARTGPRSDRIFSIDCAGANPDIRILSADVADNLDWPYDEFEDKNNHSVVVMVAFGSSTFLFTGDLEEPTTETMVEYYDGTRSLDIDVYQVGHHGSYNGTTPTLLEAMTPLIAVLSMGPATDHTNWTAYAYGHPRLALVELLRGTITRSRSRTKTVPVATAVRCFRNQTMRDAIYGTGWDGTHPRPCHHRRRLHCHP